MSASSCYDRNCLAAWSLGHLDSPRFEEVSAHLERCSTCQQVVAALDSVADPLLEMLRQPQPVADTRGTNTPPAQPSTISQRSETKPLVTGTEASSPFPHGLPGIELDALIGKGGMGRVYRARHLRLNRVVAVKVMAQALAQGEDARKRFEREMQVLAQLDHPNIVRIHHADEANGVPYLVMDYLEGVSLAELVRQRGRLAVAQACVLIRQAAAGLEHAHARGVTHRDVKPGNLLLTRDGVLKVLDMGLARWSPGVSGEDSLTGSAVVMGTPGYVAPEQVSDPRSAGPPADVFSLGCTFYYLLTGEAPFPGESPAARLQALGKMSPKPLAEIRPDCPREVLEMVATMMDRNPTRRGTAGGIAERLGLPGSELQDRPERRPRPASNTARRRWLWVGGVLALAVGILGVALWLNYSPATTQDTARGTGADPDDGKPGEIANMSGGVDINLVRFSPNLRFAVTSELGPLRLWDLQKRKLVASWGNVESRPYPPSVFTPDGRLVVTAPQLHASDPATGKSSGKYIREWKDAAVHDISFSPDGKQFLTAQYNGLVSIWDIATGKQLREFKHGVGLTTACLTPDAKFILSGGADKVVRLWDIENDRQEKSYEGHEGPLELVRFFPDGKKFVSVSLDGPGASLIAKVIVWDFKSGKQLHKLNVEKIAGAPTTQFYALAYAPAARRLLVAHQDGSISLWDLEKAERVSQWAAHKKGYVRAVDITPDGRSALSVGAGDQLLRYWRLPAAPVRRPLPQAIKDPGK